MSKVLKIVSITRLVMSQNYQRFVGYVGNMYTTVNVATIYSLLTYVSAQKGDNYEA